MKKAIFLSIFSLLVFSQYLVAQDCVMGNCIDGFGTMKYEDGSTYIGEFKFAKKNGQGVQTYANGNKYVGTWKENHSNGEGRMSYDDGTTQAGHWEEGAFVTEIEPGTGCIWGDCVNGYGIYLYKSGIKYIGDFSNGEPSNHGAAYYPTGEKYVGEWTHKDANGNGTKFLLDGETEEGLWKDGLYVGASRAAKGCVEGNCRNGEGTYIYLNNTKYSGEFFNGEAHGKGTCFYSNGDKYIGTWKYHNFEGKGTMYSNDGSIQSGYWKDGAFLGAAAPEKKENAKSLVGVKKKQPKIWAVLVGVARYNHMKSLKYTDDDAYRMYAFLKSPEGGALPDNQIRILVDEDATKDKILGTMTSVFEKASGDDMVLFYFSGHGLKGAFLPIDYDGTNNRLEHKDIAKLFAKNDAKYKLCIADACHSGSIGTKSAEIQGTIESFYEAFRNSKGGTALMMSSKAEETSIENNGLRQGIFSHFLIRGLKGAADKDNNSIVTVGELFNYVEANVKYYTQNHQTPVLHGDYDHTMPVGAVRDSF